jgi:two-component system chemotaxis sensor kinase CheA
MTVSWFEGPDMSRFRTSNGWVVAAVMFAVLLASSIAVAMPSSCPVHPAPGTSSVVSWFTNYGNYMPRVHCLRTADGKPDWFWIVLLIAETALVVLGYLRIYVFWLKCYFSERAENRNKKLWQLANVFLMCAITGYLLSITMFFWPAYRLVALASGALVPATLAFLWNLKPFEVTFAAVRLLRERDVAQAELSERNRAMRLIFDHVAQGFITVDLNGVMASERSAIVDVWFGEPVQGTTLSAYLSEIAPDYAVMLELGLGQLRDDFLPLEASLPQLPTRFTTKNKTFDVSYTPILEGSKVERLLVVVNDVSAHLAGERSEREQRELVVLFQRISTDRTGVEQFIAEGAELVAMLRAPRDPLVEKRLLHTLKGNCALMGLASYAGLVNQVENELELSGDGLSDKQRGALVEAWKDAMRRLGLLLGGLRRNQIEIDRDELEMVVVQAQAGTPGRELLPLISQWFCEPVERRFERLASHTHALARRLGKPEPKLVLAGNGVRLDPERWTGYWSAMVHVVRNAVDHGLESADVRRARGKPENGTIEVAAQRTDERLVISVRDDGAGVNWDVVRRKAAAAGLPHQTREQLIAALFVDGLSVRDQSDDISGRGVGLAALQQAVSELGGSIDVESEHGAGATFYFTFVERSVMERTATRSTAPPTSLFPALAC